MSTELKGWDSSVGMATRYELPTITVGEISRLVRKTAQVEASYILLPRYCTGKYIKVDKTGMECGMDW
jgi:hypothetical protein